MKQQLFAFLLVLFTLISCGDKPLDPSKPVYVTVKTTMGDVTVLLYDDTPLHRDNFIRLCQSGEYEGMLLKTLLCKAVIRPAKPMNQVFCMETVMEVIPFLPRYFPTISINEVL